MAMNKENKAKQLNLQAAIQKVELEFRKGQGEEQRVRLQEHIYALGETLDKNYDEYMKAGKSNDEGEEEGEDEEREVMLNSTVLSIDANNARMLTLLQKRLIEENVRMIDVMVNADSFVEMVKKKWPKTDNRMGVKVDFGKFGKYAMRALKQGFVPRMTTLVGSMGGKLLKEKKRQMNRNRRKEGGEGDVALVVAEVVVDGVGTGGGGTGGEKDLNKARIQQIYKFFKDKGELSLGASLLDKHSFSHTIENIFHTTFMVKEGIARLKLNKEGKEVMWQVGKPVNVANADADDDGGGVNENKQTILKFDYKTYMAMLEKYEEEGGINGLLPWEVK